MVDARYCRLAAVAALLKGIASLITAIKKDNDPRRPRKRTGHRRNH